MGFFEADTISVSLLQELEVKPFASACGKSQTIRKEVMVMNRRKHLLRLVRRMKSRDTDSVLKKLAGTREGRRLREMDLEDLEQVLTESRVDSDTILWLLKLLVPLILSLCTSSSLSLLGWRVATYRPPLFFWVIMNGTNFPSENQQSTRTASGRIFSGVEPGCIVPWCARPNVGKTQEWQGPHNL